MLKLLSIICLFMLPCIKLAAQDADSTIDALQQIPAKYIKAIDSKIDKYSSRVTDKTEKTLTKLSKWENKVRQLLQEVNPEAAERLFGNNQLTFASLLQKIQEGKDIALQYRTQYDQYRDKLTTNLKYLQAQKENINEKLVKPLQDAGKKMEALNEQEDKSESIQQFIKDRKKQVIDGAFQYIGNSKYLSKINKEAWYYAETVKNYKEIFRDEVKLEQTVKGILNRVPAFKNFFESNSFLSTIFGTPGGSGMGVNGFMQIEGLQTRASVAQLIQTNLVSGNPNAVNAIQQQMQGAKAELNKLKDKISQYGNNGGDIPEFVPNKEKTKCFFQRIEYGANIQFGPQTNFYPVNSDIALTIGYKFHQNLSAGFGLSYKLGLGKGFDNIRLSNEGIGIRSYFDFKLKGKIYLSGGYEQNYSHRFKSLQQIKNSDLWQKSALLGISKKINLKGKAAKIQLLYDFLSFQHIPVSQPFIYRINYSLK